MTLVAEDIRFIKKHLGEWLGEQSLGKPPVGYEVELRERMVRIEEELGHQRELIKTVLEQMDKRFSALQNDMDRRFEAADKRFEAVQVEMNRRFDAVDKRFEAMQVEMNRRFDAVDKRFEALTKRIDRVMIWSYATTLTVGGLVVAALKLLL